MRTSPEPENLVRIGTLKREEFSQAEFDGLVQSGTARLTDARNATLALESRFDLAYNAAHALALAALRRAGYRSGNRYAVFQALPHTAEISSSDWRVLALAHGRRNQAEYEGYADVDELLIEGVIRVAELLLTSLAQTA
jgi:hypothetical protein